MARRYIKRAAPPPRWRDRQAAASTPELRLGVAYDRLRAGLAWLRRAQPRNPASYLADHELADGITDQVAALLIPFCEQIETRKAVTHGDRTPVA